MKWPPCKSWTSTSLQKGFRHFVAINYGGQGKQRWVLLVSVLDGNARCVVSWSEMMDSSKWISGWMLLSRKEANPTSDDFSSFKEDGMNNNHDCLHPSKDSGLLIPLDSESTRPWF